MADKEIQELSEHMKRKLSVEAQNELNRAKKAENSVIWETEALSQKLKEEASYVEPEEKEKIDKILDDIAKKDDHVEPTPELKEAIKSIFADHE